MKNSNNNKIIAENDVKSNSKSNPKSNSKTHSKSHSKNNIPTMSGTLDSYNAISREDNRVTIQTEGGTITRSNLPLTGLNPDNNDFFEERGNPLSSKGSY